MQVVVVGATGFIGSHVTARLAAAGHHVRGLARDAAGEDTVRRAGAEPIRGDLEDLQALLPQLRQAEAVVYAAQLLLQPEHDAVKAILDALDGRGKTFIFTSGTGVLSQRTDGAWSEDSFAEDDDFIPSRYIGFRRVTEMLVQTAAGRGIRSMVVRPPLVWGHGRCSALRAMAMSAARTGAVCYVGTGLALYSNVHVDDLAEVYRLALERGQAGALYHAVAGEANNRSVARTMAHALGVPTRSVDLEEASRIWSKFTALIQFSVCSRSRSPRTRRELGWQPDPARLDILQEAVDPVMLAHAAAQTQ